MYPGTIETFGKNGGYAQSPVMFLRLNRFPVKDGTFDFETTIAHVNNMFTFITVSTNINSAKEAEPIFLNSTIANESAAIVITQPRMLCSLPECVYASTMQHARSQKR